MTQPSSLLAFGSVLSAGYLILKLSSYRAGRIETLSLSWLAGALAESWFLMVWSISGFSLERPWVLFADGVLCAVALSYAARVKMRSAGAIRRSPIRPDTEHAASYLLVRSFAILLLGYFAMHFIVMSQKMISFTDAVMSYDFKAKAIAYEGKFNSVIYHWPEVITPNFFYPPLVTLLHAHYYILGGENPAVVYTFFLMALAGIMYAGLSHLTAHRVLAVLGAFFIAALPTSRKFSLMTTLDFVATCYYGMGCIYLLLFEKRREKKFLVIAAWGFAGVGLLRPEAAPFMAGTLLAILWHFGWTRAGRRIMVLTALAYLVTVAPYEFFLRFVLRTFPESQLDFEWGNYLFVTRWADALATFIRHFMSDRLMFAGPAMLGLMILAKRSDRSTGLAAKLMVCFFISWFAVVMSDNASDWKSMRLGWSYFRIFARISPLLIFYVFSCPLVVDGLNELLALSDKGRRSIRRC